MSPMLVLTPEQVREVCRREQEERKKKEVKRVFTVQRQNQRLATYENTRGLESKLSKLELAEKQHLLSLWTRNTRQSKNLVNDSKNLMVRINYQLQTFKTIQCLNIISIMHI